MKFVNIKYEGKTPYTDRTPLRNAWEPGETKLVSEGDAKLLCRYLEFVRVPNEPAQASEQDAALTQAKTAQAVVKTQEKQAKEQEEATLLEVSQMTKGALAEFAKANYGVELDMKNKADDLRNQVTALVQGGRF